MISRKWLYTYRMLTARLHQSEPTPASQTSGFAVGVAAPQLRQISLNDEPFDSATSQDLPKLKGTLMRLKQNADAGKTPAVVTIISDTQAKYSRTIDVLDALAVAKIDNVTFTVAEEE